MSLNGSGVFSVNTAGQPVQSGTLITAAAFNAFTADVATALSTALYKDGQQTATANQPMGTYKHTGVGDATARTQYASAGQVQDGALQYLTSVSGTNTITAGTSPTPAAYAAGQRFSFIVGTTNTGAVTLNVSALGAKSVTKKMSGGKVALVANDLIANQSAEVFYDGTDFILETARTYSQGANVVSANTINLDTTTGDLIDVTGTTAITAITLVQGEQRMVRFTDILTLTNGASLVLPGGANITTAAGDFAVFRGYASGVVRCVTYSPISGLSLARFNVPQLQPITASVAANAITVSASALTLDFRATSLTNGAVTTVSGTPANLTIAASDSFGLVTAAGSQRIAVLAINNAGTIELAATALSGGVSIDETGVITTVTAATTGTQIKSTTARSNVAYRVIGLIDATFTTATGWGSLALVQGTGGNAAESMQSLGYGQTWQNVTGSRAAGTTYYNNTGRPIVVNVYVNYTSNASNTYTVNGVTVAGIGGSGAAANMNMTASFVVPPGASYLMSAGGGTISSWSELR